MPQEQSISICPYCKESCAVGYGFCHCGCGEITTIAPHTDRCCVKGNYRQYIFGHQKRLRGTIEDAMPFKINGVYCRLIPLTQGLHTVVWDEDYLLLAQWKWNASWSKNMNSYYATRKIWKEEVGIGKQYIVRMHRDILGLSVGDIREGDHINGLPFDNRRDNLRIVDDLQSAQNAKRRSDNTSGYKGVSWVQDSRKWRSRISIDGKRVLLGDFDDVNIAGDVYREASIKYHKEYARLK